MARRATFFERLIDDYSSDSAAGARSDRTTPQLAAEIDTPRGADDSRTVDDRRFMRDEFERSEFEDG